jgi:Zn-dependent peptidase ImmA (M78 family)/DNA-binding XRE family transcriptional regulator
VRENQEKYNPARLTLARKRRGLTKTELAERIGVDLRSVVAYEADRSPKEEVLQKIQSILDFPAEFFLGSDLDVPTDSSVSFRAMSKMSARQRDMALGQGAICLHLNKWLEAKFDLPTSLLPDLSRESSPEAASETLRREWTIGELPIRNAVHLLEAKGVRVFSLSVHAREVDAFSTWKESTPFVFLNMHKTSEHGRFDAAHELGHLVLHRHGSPNGREAEREADTFASAFLMPRGSVLASAPRFVTLAGLIKLKRNWGVSVAALNHRFHQLGILSDWQYRTLCIEIAKNGYRTSEPDGCERESSQLLAKVLKQLASEGLSRGQIARELCISNEELNEMMFGLVMVGIEGGQPFQDRRTVGNRKHLSLVGEK